jgi:hypothetical protein
MRREFHVRFSEGGGVGFPSATRCAFAALERKRMACTVLR